MQFNEGVDAVVLKPVATVYREDVPPLVRTGVSNFFGNLGDVWSFVNSVLQLKFQNAAENFMRFERQHLLRPGRHPRHRQRPEHRAPPRGLRPDAGPLGRAGRPVPRAAAARARPRCATRWRCRSTPRRPGALPCDRQRERATRCTACAPSTPASNLLRVGDVLDEAALDKYSFTRDAHLQAPRGPRCSSRGRAARIPNAGSDANTAPGACPATPRRPLVRVRVAKAGPGLGTRAGRRCSNRRMRG